MKKAIPPSRRPARSEALVSVVLPVYNERQILEALLLALSREMSKCAVNYEIIFVNDGSDDGSREILDDLTSRYANVRVIHFSRNFGHQAAVQAGLSYAAGDAIVLMDSDMQDAPEAIPRFLSEWADGYDVVYAIRVARKESRLKRAMFRLFYRVLARLSSTHIPLDAGNFGLIDRRVAQELLAMAERDRYFSGLRSWVGFRQRGIEVERLARYDRSPRVSLKGLVKLAKTALFSFSTFPLTIFYTIGFLALLVFLGLGSFSVFCKLFTDLAIPGWTSHILSACFFGALNALGISILGEYVIRIYDQVRGRPLFVVDRVVNPARSRSDYRGEIDEPLLAKTTDDGTVEVDEEEAIADLLDQSRMLLDAVQIQPATSAAEQDVAP